MVSTSGLTTTCLLGKPLSGFPVVDFHVHLGRWRKMHCPCTGDDMIPKMDRVGVERICVNAFFLPDTRAGNDAVAEFVRRYPDRAVGFCTLNPWQGDIEDELKRCVNEYRFRGIKLHELLSEGNRRHTMAPPRQQGRKWEKVWALAAEFKIPVLYHGVVTEEDIKNFPETIFVCAHGFCMIKGEDRKHRLAGYPNFYLDTAATQNTPWEAEETVRILGPERVLWGTDAPLDDFAQCLGIVLDLPVSDEDKKKILGGNAEKLLKLGIE